MKPTKIKTSHSNFTGVNPQIAFDLQAFQNALDQLPREGVVMRIESLRAGLFQFHWKDLCEQADESELQDVLHRNHALASDSGLLYEFLAKYIATKFMMQRCTWSKKCFACSE